MTKLLISIVVAKLELPVRHTKGSGSYNSIRQKRELIQSRGQFQFPPALNKVWRKKLKKQSRFPYLGRWYTLDKLSWSGWSGTVLPFHLSLMREIKSRKGLRWLTQHFASQIYWSNGQFRPLDQKLSNPVIGHYSYFYNKGLMKL